MPLLHIPDEPPHIYLEEVYDFLREAGILNSDVTPADIESVAINGGNVIVTYLKTGKDPEPLRVVRTISMREGRDAGH